MIACDKLRPRLPEPGTGLLVVGLLSAGMTGPVCAQGTFDPAQLPATSGRVAFYSLTPHGDVDGLILLDGLEVHLPPRLGAQLAATVRPGDAVVVHGLRARAIPMVEAMSVTNMATGRTVTDAGGLATEPPPNLRGGPGEMLVQGVIRSQLHGPRGDFNGVLLSDGTIIRMPPSEADRLSGQLQPGLMVAAQGPGTAGGLGRAITARRIGPHAGRLAPLTAHPRPEPPPR